VTAPMDPNEPLFPVRPNEPMCQYYMKHGTCKFGQACRFHHPPQAQMKTLSPGNGNSGLLVNMGHNNEVPHQLVLNPVATDGNGNLIMLQFLPQRPEEPDCIYFLKNGRCKYGGSCRYHHPINFHQRISGEDSRSTRPNLNQESYRLQNAQYVNQLQSASAVSLNRQQSSSDSAHHNIDSSAIARSFRPLQIITSSDGTTSYGIPLNDQGSSASSLASSYDTTGSSFEHLTGHGGDGNALWNRVRRNGSGCSLNAYGSEFGNQQRAQLPILHSSASDGNIRRLRNMSYGSSSECNNSHHDTASMSTQSISRNTSVGSWQNSRPAPVDPNRRAVNHFVQRQQQPQQNVPCDYAAAVARSPHSRGRSHVNQGQVRRSPTGRSRQGEDDQGFTMMTSALLNMLDTPEEPVASFEDYDEDPRLMAYASQYPSDHEAIDPSAFYRMNLRDDLPPGLVASDNNSWSPTIHGQVPSHEPQVLSMHHHHGMPDHNHHADTDIGLYLP
jgi:hypothetical protein